jgi:hypothetical protein
MKLKSLAVITLFVLGCDAAFAQGSATLGFTSAAGEYCYCNYEQIQWGGDNNFYLQGIDYETACGAYANGTMEGVKAPINGYYAVADNIYDAESGRYTGDQWFLLTQTKPSKLLHDYGWVGYVGFDGYEFLGNYGYLSECTLGSKPVLNQSNAGAALQSETRTKMIQK